MNKGTNTAVLLDATGTYRRMLLDKREQVVSGLGAKFDTLAGMGRVAEEDQAQLSHDEFVSLRLNSLDYGSFVWWKKPSTACSRETTACALLARGPSRRNGYKPCHGRVIASPARKPWA